jgi:putative hydrolase of the HAD superfamily
MIDAATRSVFFDAVGTLLFPRQPVAQTYAEVARRHGSRLTEADIRPRFRPAFARQEQIDESAGWRTDEDREKARWRAIVAETIPDADADSCFAELWAHFSRPDAWAVHEEAEGIFAELTRRGIVPGIASNFDARLTGLVEAIQTLAPVRDQCVVSSLVGFRKPAAEFFAVLPRAAGCQPGRMLYVGDDLRNDIEGAAAAGIRAVLYDPDGLSTDGRRIRRLRDILPPGGVTTG